MSLEGALDAVEGKTSEAIKAGRTRILERWIPKASDAEPKAKPAYQFADPAKR